MLGMSWVGVTRRNQVKDIPIQKLRTVILELRTANAIWFVLKKKCKNYGPQMLGWKREFTALKRFSQGKKWILTSPRPEHLSTDWRGDPKQKRRGRTSLERDLKENSRTGREIVDLLGVVFFLLFSHVVLLFEHESWYNL
jgi:hypothetical protein